MPLLRSSFTVCILLFASISVQGSEADEYREKANAIRQEAAELAALGRNEEAKKLAREAAELYKISEQIRHKHQDTGQTEVREMKRRIEQLMREERELANSEEARPRVREIRAEREELVRALQEIASDMRRRDSERGEEHHRGEMRDQEHRHHDHHEGDHHEGDHHEHHQEGHHEHHEGEHHDDGRHHAHEEMAHRLENMHIAVDHLHQAGLHDIAEHVAERAEQTERELHEMRRQEEERHHNPLHEMMRQIEELRHEIGRLHQEFDRIRDR